MSGTTDPKKDSPKGGTSGPKGAREAANKAFLQRPRQDRSPQVLLDGLRNGDRGALARALTLVESQLPADRAQARALLDACLGEQAAMASDSFRLGITGVPGAGKSTFIEALGMQWIEEGHRVAVQAVDPSSAVSRGSILGDKTRMERLATHADAFIRPSPARGVLGGVTDRTREYVLLFETAGYDRLIVETVGVGQSETAVHGMVDGMLLLLVPGAGDELQGIKRGIVEMADWLVVNKADADNQVRAAETEADYRRALHLFPPTDTGWTPQVMRCSALTGEGLPHVAEALEAFRNRMLSGGHFAERRRRQAGSWLHQAINDGLTAGFYTDPAVKKALQEAESAVLAGDRHPLLAAEELLSAFEHKS